MTRSASLDPRAPDGAPPNRRRSARRPHAPGESHATGRAGVLFASAHLGPWERVASTARRSRRTDDVALARETYPTRASRAVYDRLRGARAGAGDLSRPRSWSRRPRASCATLRGGGVLGVPGWTSRSRVPSVSGAPPRTRRGDADPDRRGSRFAQARRSSWEPSRPRRPSEAQTAGAPFASRAPRSRQPTSPLGKKGSACSRRESTPSSPRESRRCRRSGSGCTIASRGEIS